MHRQTFTINFPASVKLVLFGKHNFCICNSRKMKTIFLTLLFIFTHSSYSASNDSVPRASFNLGLFAGSLLGFTTEEYGDFSENLFIYALTKRRLGFKIGYDKLLYSKRMHNFYGNVHYLFYNSAIEYSLYKQEVSKPRIFYFNNTVKIPCHYLRIGISDKINLRKFKLFLEPRFNYNILLKSSMSEYDTAQKYLATNVGKKILWKNRNFVGLSLNFNYILNNKLSVAFNIGGSPEHLLRVRTGPYFGCDYFGMSLAYLIPKKSTIH